MNGNPSRDMIILGDELHRTMMERGSNRLLEAIKGRYAAPAGLMWVKPYTAGVTVREAVNDAELPAVERNPCVRCGVRRDRHSEGGCASFQRSRVA